jgi:hypothetical protein
MRLKVILAVVLLLVTASLAAAQITSATISGTIKDETGGVLPGVDVVVTNLDTGLTRSVVTDSNGYFTVPGLAPGRYEARASLQGFRTGVQTGIALQVAQQAGLNLVLKVGATEESITVSGESALVETRSAALSAIVLGKTIEELPLNGRNYITLATLQPGIVQFTEKSGTAPATRGVQLNINGMGGRSNSFLMDGANIRGYAGLATVTAADTTLGVETIQEFRVVTNAFSPTTAGRWAASSASRPSRGATSCTAPASSSSATAGWTRATSSMSARRHRSRAINLVERWAGRFDATGSSSSAGTSACRKTSA